jgi:Flp pilus assembly protein TadD
MGRLEEAVADFSRALTLDPGNASSHNARGLARDRSASAAGVSPAAATALREAALADFAAAIALEQDNPVFRHNRAFCYR